MHSEKLLHLFWEFPPYIEGGLGVAGESLCRALSSQIQIDIALPYQGERLAQDHHAPYNVFQFRSESGTSTPSTSSYSTEQYTEQLNNQMAEFEANVLAAHFTQYKAIHAHDWVTAQAAFSAQSVNKYEAVPVILHIHSTQVERVGPHSRGSIFRKEQSAMRRADKIIAVSHKTKQTIVDYYSIEPAKIMVIHNAPPAVACSKIRAASHPPTILFAGRMESQKSPFFAIEVICKVLKSMPEAKAVIAGEGSKLQFVRELVKFKNLDHRIEVLGKVPQHQMSLLYESSHVLLMPSIDEPFGLVALEAAQSGLAVIASDRCGATEILKSSPRISINTEASLKTWVDTAIELLSQTQSMEMLVQAQFSDLCHCTWEKSAQQLLQVING